MFSSGDRVGPYELVELLGAGGMGEVWKALDPRLGREVAIKLLSGDLATDRDRLRRFESEARTASALSHANILTVFDVGTWAGAPYLVTELLEGATLREIEEGRPIELERAIAYAREIASGLAAAHKRGIAHRDIKPENIFVTSDGPIKILDFGLAQLAPEAEGELDENTSTATRLTLPGTVLGTVGYMSPEQVRGRRMDIRSDVFSFGCLLFEMLTGAPPFERKTAIETMVATLRREPPEPADLGRPVPAAVERILRRCLHKKPRERYPSAAELLGDLETVSQGLATGEVRVRAGAWRLPAWTRRRRGWLAAGLATAAAAAAVAWLYGPAELRSPLLPAAVRQPDTRLASIAVLPFRNSSADPALEHLCDGLSEELINVLGRVERLRVPGRTSSFRFKDRQVDLAEVADKLAVDHVLEGSVQIVDERLRVRAQLVALPEGYQLWSDSYDGDRADLYAIQRRVATSVVDEVLGETAGDQLAPAAEARAIDFESHELFLQGRYYLNRRTADGMNQALGYFQQVLERERDWAAAWSGLADSYSLLAEYGHLPIEEAVPKAEAAARHALALEPGLADGHASLGLVLDLAGRSREAEREYRLALAEHPRHVNAHLWLGSHLVTEGRTQEALPFLERAVELDPLLMVARVNVVISLYMERRFDEALAYAERATAFASPEEDLLPWWLAWLYAERGGRPDEALAICDRWIEREASEPVARAQWRLLRAISLVYAGREREARAVIESVESQWHRELAAYGIADMIALAYAALGETDRFIRWAKETLPRDPSEFSVAQLERSPELDRVRSDPRFSAFLEWRRSREGGYEVPEE